MASFGYPKHAVLKPAAMWSYCEHIHTPYTLTTHMLKFVNIDDEEHRLLLVSNGDPCMRNVLAVLGIRDLIPTLETSREVPQATLTVDEPGLPALGGGGIWKDQSMEVTQQVAPYITINKVAIADPSNFGGICGFLQEADDDRTVIVDIFTTNGFTNNTEWHLESVCKAGGHYTISYRESVKDGEVGNIKLSGESTIQKVISQSINHNYHEDSLAHRIVFLHYVDECYQEAHDIFIEDPYLGSSFNTVLNAHRCCKRKKRRARLDGPHTWKKYQKLGKIRQSAEIASSGKKLMVVKTTKNVYDNIPVRVLDTGVYVTACPVLYMEKSIVNPDKRLRGAEGYLSLTDLKRLHSVSLLNCCCGPYLAPPSTAFIHDLDTGEVERWGNSHPGSIEPSQKAGLEPQSPNGSVINFDLDDIDII